MTVSDWDEPSASKPIEVPSAQEVYDAFCDAFFTTGIGWFMNSRRWTDLAFVAFDRAGEALFGPPGSGWTTDAEDSWGIDKGNPWSPFDLEPTNHGDRVNIGAYGNTEFASKGGTDVVVRTRTLNDYVFIDESDKTWPLVWFSNFASGSPGSTSRPSRFALSYANINREVCVGRSGSS